MQATSLSTENLNNSISTFLSKHTGFSQLRFSDNWDDIILNLLSGPSILFFDGINKALIIDARTYPVRSIEEPDNEKASKGSRDGFVETLLSNANLIRRRIRSTKLTFEILTTWNSALSLKMQNWEPVPQILDPRTASKSIYFQFLQTPVIIWEISLHGRCCL